MERFSEKEFARRLRGFNAVWQRVQRGRRPAPAEAAGLPLMPRRKCRPGCRPR